MTVGFFSPLPPAPTGIADYAAALLKAMRRTGSVEVSPAHPEVGLYHIGNNQLHATIYRQALAEPGIAVLHDAVLQHFFLGSLKESEYIDEFVYNYGPWSESVARSLWRSRARSGTDPSFFRFPMLKRIAETSGGVIVHNPAAVALVKSHAPGARIFEIPHLFELPARPSVYETERVRADLGCGGGTLLWGVFGHLRESKRLMTILRAQSKLKERNDGSRYKLLIAGNCASGDLARSLEWGLGEGVIRLPYLEETDFWRLACAVDVCVNLRYPGAGETSGIAIRMMGIGKPVILTLGPESERFPEGSWLPCDPGEAEVAMLVEYLAWLAESPGSRSAIGRRAAAHINQCHDTTHVADMYWGALRTCYQL